jgi:hypothetical protein
MLTGSTALVSSNRNSAIYLLTNQKLPTGGEISYNTKDATNVDYDNRSPRIYIQQVSPLSRGSTGVEFNGNSILGGNIASHNVEISIKNPLYYSNSGSLSYDLKSKIDSANFAFDSSFCYSTVDSRPSPYLILPGDKLTISMSKTRPVIYKMIATGGSPGAWTDYGSYQLTGSHDTVMLNTGSIDITVYGSYVREGMEFNP